MEIYNVMFHLLTVSFPAGPSGSCTSTSGLSMTLMVVVEKMRNLIKDGDSLFCHL
jgi:hypothetical protein